MYKEIKECRACGSNNIDEVLNLSEQYMTGFFPKSETETPSKGPLSFIFPLPNIEIIGIEQSPDI